MVIHATRSHVRYLNVGVTPKRLPTQWEKVMLQTLGVTVKEIGLRRGKWVRWTKPSDQCVTLNVDGSRRGMETTAGGVLRDANGDFMFGFAVKLTHADILQAELEAIWYGLRMCKERH